ncbi:ATP-binding cassette domain-containing protein [Leucobacter allii]|uniref:ABC transporter ATP-binding protein n=1 Tax=Leucobacter allii TaxID=2932247 RepID=UPI001FD509AF|nr:ATP-binding cassette domain-containing protein [Leucobacter allii]UOR01929.1 ATP-binding cassette domain-containing protein [Leucobacter allii]
MTPSTREPAPQAPAPAPAPAIRLDVRDLEVVLGHGARATRVLHGVSFAIPAGTTVGLVGESGSGKSTIAKTIVGIHRPAAGEIRFDGAPMDAGGRRGRTALRRRIQLIPQDPYSSLDPRRTIGQTLAEALDPRRASLRAHRARVSELLALVALDDSAIDRYPREFSGGQRQRIAIARALAVDPELIIADEITSALDLSTQAEILELFERLRRELALTVLFVSHNLAVVRQVSDEVIVLLHGDVVEAGASDRVLSAPEHPYTQRLVASVPGGPGFSLD